jgi:hypothetical protein
MAESVTMDAVEGKLFGKKIDIFVMKSYIDIKLHA